MYKFQGCLRFSRSCSFYVYITSYIPERKQLLHAHNWHNALILYVEVLDLQKHHAIFGCAPQQNGVPHFYRRNCYQQPPERSPTGQKSFFWERILYIKGSLKTNRTNVSIEKSQNSSEKSTTWCRIMVQTKKANTHCRRSITDLKCTQILCKLNKSRLEIMKFPSKEKHYSLLPYTITTQDHKKCFNLTQMSK